MCTSWQWIRKCERFLGSSALWVQVEECYLPWVVPVDRFPWRHRPMECLSKTPYNIHLAMSAQFKLNPDLRSSNQKFRTCPALSLGLPQQLLVNTTGGKRYKRKRLLSSQGFKWLMCTQDPSAQSLTAIVKAQSGWSLSSEYTAHLTLSVLTPSASAETGKPTFTLDFKWRKRRKGGSWNWNHLKPVFLRISLGVINGCCIKQAGRRNSTNNLNLRRALTTVPAWKVLPKSLGAAFHEYNPCMRISAEI